MFEVSTDGIETSAVRTVQGFLIGAVSGCAIWGVAFLAFRQLALLIS